MIQKLGLRNRSHVFDWLWNLDGGLLTVQKLLGNDFHRFTEAEEFISTIHPRLPDVPSIVNRHYPEVIFMHSNPRGNPQDLTTLRRRVARFRQLLRKRRRVLFLYYRQWDEPIHGRYPPDSASLIEKIDGLQEEVRQMSDF
jgi:Putative papain-like cysteine peptidase (DUF1796)